MFDELQLLKRQLAESPSRLLSAYELGYVTELGQYYVPSIQYLLYYTSDLGWCVEPVLSERSPPLASYIFEKIYEPADVLFRETLSLCLTLAKTFNLHKDVEQCFDTFKLIRVTSGKPIAVTAFLSRVPDLSTIQVRSRFIAVHQCALYSAGAILREGIVRPNSFLTDEDWVPCPGYYCRAEVISNFSEATVLKCLSTVLQKGSKFADFQHSHE